MLDMLDGWFLSLTYAFQRASQGRFRGTSRVIPGAWIICVSAVLANVAADQTKGYLGPSTLVVSKDGKTGYVANADARQIACIELPAGPVTRRIEVPAEPTGLVLSPDGSKLIVTCAAPRSTVVVLDAATGQTLSAIPAGHTAMSPAIAPDGKWLYVCNRFDNDVSMIDLAAGTEVTRVQAVREPVAAAVTPDGSAVFVANHLPNDRLDNYPVSAVVTVIDTQTRQTTAVRLPHGSHSLRGLCVSPDGK
nr:beta-propeller fold lactonase family protein [Candidatus Anammoximicrobium sp.]